MYMKRAARLNKISEFIQNDNTSNVEIMNVVTEIKKKFKDRLEDYSYVSDINNLQKGHILAYVDLNLESVKGGTIVNIIKSEYGTRTYLRLKNAHNGDMWLIKVAKHYIFYKHQGHNKLRMLLDDRFDIEEMIKKYDAANQNDMKVV